MGTMQKRIGIVTWTTYTNIGTTLQALALYYIIRKLGFNCKIISDLYIISKLKAKIPYWKRFGNKLKNIFFPSRHQFYNHQKIWKERNLEFKKEYFEIDEIGSDIDLTNNYDILICGSDQIWSAIYPLDEEYINHFFLKNFKGSKIAYAPSININSTSPDYESIIIPLLEDFAALSVREPQGAKYISRITKKDVPVLLDPTLLLSAEEWISVLDLKKNQLEDSHSDYYFCYLLSYNPLYLECIEKRAKQDGKRLIIVSTHPKFERRGHKLIYGSPNKFLETLINSAGVFTDSFHCSIFSLIFSKPLIIFKRFKGTITASQNIRIANLLKIFNIPPSSIADGSNPYPPFTHVPKSEVTQILSDKRTESISFILKGINPSERSKECI